MSCNNHRNRISLSINSFSSRTTFNNIVWFLIRFCWQIILLKVKREIKLKKTRRKSFVKFLGLKLSFNYTGLCKRRWFFTKLKKLCWFFIFYEFISTHFFNFFKFKFYIVLIRFRREIFWFNLIFFGWLWNIYCF